MKKNESGSSGIVVLVILVVLVAAIAGGMYYGASHHFVTTDKGRIVLPKRFLTYTDTSVDIRGWTYADVTNHVDLSKALEQGGYGDILPKPPKPPTFAERAAAKAGQVKEATVEFWDKTKAKIHEATKPDDKSAKPSDASGAAM